MGYDQEKHQVALDYFKSSPMSERLRFMSDVPEKQKATLRTLATIVPAAQHH